MSERTCEEISTFTVVPVGLVCNQVPLAEYITPGLTASLILAINPTCPRSFHTVTASPSPIPRVAASAALISSSSGPLDSAQPPKVAFVRFADEGLINTSG